MHVSERDMPPKPGAPPAMPIAVIGMALRVPGATTPVALLAEPGRGP